MPDKHFTIFTIDGWFVIAALVIIVLLTAFYLSLLVIPIFRKRQHMLVQEPTGKKIRMIILFIFLLSL